MAMYFESSYMPLEWIDEVSIYCTGIMYELAAVSKWIVEAQM